MHHPTLKPGMNRVRAKAWKNTTPFNGEYILVREWAEPATREEVGRRIAEFMAEAAALGCVCVETCITLPCPTVVN